MAVKVGSVFDGARALLNDLDIAVFTNINLMPYFQMAFEDLRLECEDSNIPVTNKTSEAITITSGVRNIGGNLGPALPNDFIEPITLWEITAGTNNDYMKMRQMRFLPKTSVLTAYLEVWAFQEEYIHFLGASGNIQVKMDYVASSLGTIVDENSLITLRNSINYLKFATAAYASQFIGENESRAQVLAGLAQKSLDNMLNIKVKSQQAINTRRRPFMASYKQRGSQQGR